MTYQKLPLSKQLAYASGMFGWSIMVNIITVIVIYFYLPPSTSGMVNLIKQTAVLGAVNAMTLLMTGSKVADMIADPLVAHATDSSKNPKGRRIPFMKYWIIPSFVFCVLVFFPISNIESDLNIIWLSVMLPLFFISTTAYAIPYNALLPELAHTSGDKLRLSSFQSLGFVAGVGLSANAFNFTDIVQHYMPSLSRMQALQYSVGGLALLGAIAMSLPVFFIDESKYARFIPSTVSIRTALRRSFGNRNFMVFIAADLVYFMAIAVITSGLMYYVSVLARQEESAGNMLMITMAGVSLLFYPLVNKLAIRIGKKVLVIVSFAIMSIVFLAIYSLGKLPVSPMVQLYALVSVFAVPFAVLGILPNTIVAEIAEEDALRTGHNNEGMFYAVRLLFDKFGQMFGLALFSFLTVYGKDRESDFGLRLNGLVGCVLCIIAGIIFFAFKEKRKSK
jgi:GPH family glycoside/pentoside/hexuronide:cation symporter